MDLQRFIGRCCSAMLFFCALNGTATYAEAPGEMRWLGGDLPPYLWKDSNGQAEGYGAELIAAMGKLMGRTPMIEFVPWARAVRTAEDEAAVGVLPLTRSTEREAVFHWVIHLDQVHHAFFVRQEKGQAIPAFALHLDRLRDKRIGVLRGSPMVKRLQSDGFTRISEDTSYLDLLRRLDAGALDAIYGGLPMLSMAIRQSGLPAERFPSALRWGDGNLYLGTGRRTEANEIEAWKRAYSTLERNGTVARLRAKYGLARLQ